MRTIKFRAWDGKAKEMRLVRAEDLRSNEFNLFVEHGELMQFTGLLDKNGKEIYEGDILQFQKNGGIGAVIWDERQARFKWRGLGLTHINANHRLYVIGNIYENPQLLPNKD